MFGWMVENMKENIQWTRNMGLEFILGLMERDFKDFGKMGNRMGKENTILKVNAKREYGI